MYALPRHFALIDGLRGVAALAVVIFHYHHFYLADFADRPNMPRLKRRLTARFCIRSIPLVTMRWNCSG